jgi:hypothetical protein
MLDVSFQMGELRIGWLKDTKDSADGNRDFLPSFIHTYICTGLIPKERERERITHVSHAH